MKVRIVTAAALLALGGWLAAGIPAHAEETGKFPPVPGGREPAAQRRAAMRLQNLAAQLELTTEQQATLRPILEAEANAMRALRMDTSISPEDQQVKFQSLRESYRGQIQAVLTPEQQIKLEEVRKQARAKMNESGGQKRKGRIPVSPDVD